MENSRTYWLHYHDTVIGCIVLVFNFTLLPYPHTKAKKKKQITLLSESNVHKPKRTEPYFSESKLTLVSIKVSCSLLRDSYFTLLSKVLRSGLDGNGASNPAHSMTESAFLFNPFHSLFPSLYIYL